MQKAAINLKNYVISSDAEYNDMNRESDIFCVSVSIDGTRQKRYGFNSLLGAVFIISIETGEILDYEVKHKYSFECKSRGKWDKQSVSLKQMSRCRKLANMLLWNIGFQCYE